MTTDFNKNAISINGGIRPSTFNTPGDLRTRVETEADIMSIPKPYLGMIVYVLDSGKYFKITGLKAGKVGMLVKEDAFVDTYEEFVVKGKSAYDIAVENGFEGSEEEWLKDIEYDDSDLKERLEVLESIDHNEFLKEHQDISHLAVKVDVDDAMAAHEQDTQEKLDAVEAQIAEEAARAQAAEEALDGKFGALEAQIANEVARAQAAEEAVEAQIADEVARAQAAEEAVEAQIADEVARAQAAEEALDERVEVLEKSNLETKPYLDDNGMLVLCGCPAIARGVGNEVHVTVRFFNDEEDKFVFTADEFAKLRICMGYGAEGIGYKRNIAETTLELYDIDKVFIIDGGSQVTGEIGTVNIIAENINYIDGIQGARAMNGGERNIVHNFNVRVKDVKLIDTLFGGGNGYSVVWNSNIEVDGDTTVNYLIAGGSNGYTRKSHVVLNNGLAKVMQGVNRGILDRAELIVNGGVVENFYAAGEVDSSVTGEQHESYVELNGGIIRNFHPGNSKLVEFKNIHGTIMDCVVESGDISMLEKIERHPGFVDKDEFTIASQAMDERVAKLESIEHDLFAVKVDCEAAMADHKEEANAKFQEVQAAMDDAKADCEAAMAAHKEEANAKFEEVQAAVDAEVERAQAAEVAHKEEVEAKFEEVQAAMDDAKADCEAAMAAHKEEANAKFQEVQAVVDAEVERAQAAEVALDERVVNLEAIDHELFAVKTDVEAAMAAHKEETNAKFEEVQAAVDAEVERAQAAEAAHKEEVEAKFEEVDATIAEIKELIDEEKPYLADVAAYPTSKFLFACGQPITVEPNTGFKYDANYAEDDVAFVYRWADGFECIMVEKAVAEKVYVVGGYGNKNVGVKRAIPQTNILVRDVKIKGVVGGNYFEGMVGHVDMELENAEFVSIIGGGWCGASLNGKTTRMNVADDINIKATNCKISSTLFGGSQGNGVVDDVRIELNNCEVGWLTAGGANGMTRDAVIVMNGGSVKVAQSTNRGVVHKARFILNDGIVNKLYFGGETEDTTVNGLIEDGFIELNGGTVNKFDFGTNNGVVIAAEDVKGTIMNCVVKAGDVSMLEKIEPPRTANTAGYPTLTCGLNVYVEEIDESATVAEVKIVETLEEIKALAEADGFVQTTILFNLINSENTTDLQFVYGGEAIGDLVPIIEGQSYYKINMIAVMVGEALHIDIEITTSSRLSVTYSE